MTSPITLCDINDQELGFILRLLEGYLTDGTVDDIDESDDKAVQALWYKLVHADENLYTTKEKINGKKQQRKSNRGVKTHR